MCRPCWLAICAALSLVAPWTVGVAHKVQYFVYIFELTHLAERSDYGKRESGLLKDSNSGFWPY